MGGHLRILSSNHCRGYADTDAFVELVERTEADVVAVQELWPQEAEALAELLPHGRLEPHEGYLGMGIALRHPGASGRIEMPCRDAGVARLSPGAWPQLSREIEIVNLHIAAPHSAVTWRRLWRPRQMRRLRAYLDAHPVEQRVLIGDLNSTPGWPLYARLARRFDDAARVHARRRGERPSATWCPRPLAPRRLLRIDHCFATGLAIEDFQVFDLPGTDHCAILADFSVS